MVLTHNLLNINGNDYHVVENRAKKSKQDFVIIHGIIANYKELLPLLRLMEVDYNFIAIDLPGCGKSETHRSFSLQRIIEDIAEIIKYFGYKSPVLLGHSLGGVICYNEAIYNKSVKKLIVMNTPVLAEFIKQPAHGLLENYSKVASINPFVSIITAIKDSKLAFDLVDKVVSKTDEGIKEINGAFEYNYSSEALSEANASAALDYAKLLLELDLTNVLQNINIPSLIINGMDDVVVDTKSSDFVKKTNKKLQTVLLENFSHQGFVSQPERIFELLQKFI